MSVDNSKTVDAIGVDKLTDEAVLTISDHLQWSDSEHLHLLQEKINSYFAFIKNGEIFETYPTARGRDIRIDVVCKFEPNEVATQFLSKAADWASDAGLSLSWRAPKPLHASVLSNAPRER